MASKLLSVQRLNSLGKNKSVYSVTADLDGIEIPQDSHEGTLRLNIQDDILEEGYKSAPDLELATCLEDDTITIRADWNQLQIQCS
jgi:hypothetical protein